MGGRRPTAAPHPAIRRSSYVPDIPTLIQSLASGIAAGAMYGLVAMGISLIYRTTRVINFAQGHVAALGAYIAWTLYTEYELNYGLTLLVTALAVGLVMVLVEVALRPLYSRGMLFAIISTIGLAFVIEGLIDVIWGAVGKTFPSVLGSSPIFLGEIVLVPELLWIVAIGVVISFAMYLFLSRTKAGIAVRSAALDRTAASLLGISVHRAYSLAFFTAGSLAAVAGALIAPVTYMRPTMGLQLSLLGFIAALIGGLGSIQGAFIGGIVLGAAQNLAVIFISPSFKEVIAYVILAVFLLTRPTGLFGEEGVGVREV
jgi:branched-chain amino acid transport system permease protein